MKKITSVIVACFLTGISYSQIPTSGLVAFYPFNGNANDISGNSNNGVNHGATLTSNHLGTPNSAYFFNGDTAYIQVPNSNSLSFPNNQISIAFWVKVEAFPISGENNILINKQSGYGSSQSGFNVYQYFSSTIGNLVSSNAGVQSTATVPSDSANFNAFHNVVLTFNNGIAKAYLDGVLKDSTHTTASLGLNSSDLIIGKPGWSYFNAHPFKGVIDNLAFYNREISAIEVNQIYNGNICTLYDTVHVTVYDTIPTSISVTDTLIINAQLTGIAPPNNINTLKVFPNPAKDQLYINCGNYVSMSGCTLKIVNSLAQNVFLSAVNQQLFNINLNTWSGVGTYILYILDPASNIIATKEIVIQ